MSTFGMSTTETVEACRLCGRAIFRGGFYFKCHVCGAAYCYIHMPEKCPHRPRQVR